MARGPIASLFSRLARSAVAAMRSSDRLGTGAGGGKKGPPASTGRPADSFVRRLCHGCQQPAIRIERGRERSLDRREGTGRRSLIKPG